MTVRDPAHQPLTQATHSQAAPHHNTPLPVPTTQTASAKSVSEASCSPPRVPKGHLEPPAPLQRRRADVVSVAAPAKSPQPACSALKARTGGAVSDSVAAGSSDQLTVALLDEDKQGQSAVASRAPCDAVLRTQMQSLSDLSDLLSERLQLGNSAAQHTGASRQNEDDTGRTTGTNSLTVTAPARSLAPIADVLALDQQQIHAAAQNVAMAVGDVSREANRKSSCAAAALPDSIPSAQSAIVVRTVSIHEAPDLREQRPQGRLETQDWGGASDDEGPETGGDSAHVKFKHGFQRRNEKKRANSVIYAHATAQNVVSP